MLATKCKHSCKSYNGSRRVARARSLAADSYQSHSHLNHRRFASSNTAITVRVVHRTSNGTPSALRESRPTRHVNRRWIPQHPPSQATQTCRDPRTVRQGMALNFSRYGQLRVGTHDEGLHLASSQGQVGPFFCCALKATGSAGGFNRSSSVATIDRPTPARVARSRTTISPASGRQAPAIAVRTPSRAAAPSHRDRAS